MGALVDAFQALEHRFMVEPQRPSSSYTGALTADGILGWLSGDATATGARVSPEGALRLSAVYACVRVKAEDIAKLPLILHRQQGREKHPARDHRLYRLLHRVPNPLMTAMQLRETLQGHVELRGNAYANIERNDDGSIRYLWPLRPDRMAPPVLSEAGTLLYTYTLPNGEPRALTQSEVFHLRGLSPDGFTGYGPITLHRETVGWAMATREYNARFYGNGSRPGGVLQKAEGHLSEEAAARLKATWEAAHRGLETAHRVAVLEDGVTWQATGLSNEDAQYLETVNFQVQDIARIFRVPPHKIGELSRATFSNIEEQEIEYVTDTLQSLCERWEQQIYKDLLVEREQQTLYAKHNLNALLRGKTLDRFDSYVKAIQVGMYSPNDALELEDRNPFDGGDMHLQPMNMVPWGTPPAPPKPTSSGVANE